MSDAAVPARLAQVRWALLFGNFVIGCGVMCAVGTLNDLSHSLGVSVAVAGQLITISAAAVCFGAPLLASWVGGFDRRRLLALSLLWYAVGHAACALVDSMTALWILRALTVLAAAVFTPQAAAAIGVMAPPAQRGRSITLIFLGWSIASVLGMPLASYLGDTFGWRVAFGAIAGASLVGALWVHAAMPDGVRPAALSVSDWSRVLTHPVLMAMVLVTALSGAGQFTVLTYVAPYYKQHLGASVEQTSALFFWFGLFGVIGNALVSRYIDRLGAARTVALTLIAMLVGMLLWPLAHSFAAVAAVLVPWGLGCFASNSAQQARLGAAAPEYAPALLALNTSAIYLGQAAGSASGGWLIAHGGYAPLPNLGAVWLVAAIGLSFWVGRRVIVHARA
ncbi:MFS transporter [Piscinibacter koreensis]|uniref:MFS transporter n=1 Tax=Piscinibacter koreensis TaxID=2742824 RepID=A0A7Y6NR70_9BURK|nr:MFS transporter [Schlegelella koreensis]NUZ07796.1 MFS transporter [Schlegelella koreensis]